jgi:predicted metal-dependent enzyme (double-stranded beta helix superfamily)
MVYALFGLILAAVITSALISNRKQDRIMAAIDDLISADAAETAELSTVQQALTDEITRVNAALSTLGQSTDPQVATVAADLQTHVSNMQAIVSALAGVAAAQPPTA